jgi:hypothetical protein
LVPYLRKDEILVKLSKWGEGYLLSLASSVEFIKKVYEIGINKHSDTWIRDNMRQMKIDSIKYSLVVPPNAGNIYNSAPVNNKEDFDYPFSKNNSSPLGLRIGLESLSSSAQIDPNIALFESINDLNLTNVASRLDGKLPGFSC